MRISDWSSDVCSSDLIEALGPIAVGQQVLDDRAPLYGHGDRRGRDRAVARPRGESLVALRRRRGRHRADRNSVVEGKRVSVRVEVGGCGILKKQKITKIQLGSIVDMKRHYE